MIKRGKKQGWLHASQAELLPWARLNGCSFNSIDVKDVGLDGNGIVATTALSGNVQPLVTVPKDLILSRETVHLHAKADKHLRDLLDVLGDFGQTTRGSVLTFLLFQATRLCPDVDEQLGVSTVLSEYVKFLPCELLPTMFRGSELDLLVGTSLAPAIEAKMKSLQREYDHLRKATSHLDWCQRIWWNEVDGLLSFDDWLQVDSFYRSRALEFPGIGDAMVPCIDMANHAAGDCTTARYEADEVGNAQLLLIDGKEVREGEEVLITYGAEKGACEMVFSYGFIDRSMMNARDIFIDLEIPMDDPLRVAKKVAASCAPGVRLYSSQDDLRWESDFIWLICVNEEDGLGFKTTQTLEGDQELVMEWQGRGLNGAAELAEALKASELWPLYQLRVVVTLHDRVEQQLRSLYGPSDAVDGGAAPVDLRESIWGWIAKVRQLETALLKSFLEHFEDEIDRLAQNDTVQTYLQSQASEPVEEDFS